MVSLKSVPTVLFILCGLLPVFQCRFAEQVL
jgi:hypothetical protein